MLGIGTWEFPVNIMVYKGIVQIDLTDNEGAYGFALRVPGQEDNIPPVEIKSATEDGNVLHIIARVPQFPKRTSPYPSRLTATPPAARSKRHTIAKGANHNDFAVPGKDWASKLTASTVESAICVDKGDAYEIHISMKREVRADLPRNVEDHDHGKAFKVYNAGMIYDAMAGYEQYGAITKFAPTYHDSYILCTIDKATGSLKTATYKLTFDADIEGKLISALTVKASASISVTGKYVF